MSHDKRLNEFIAQLHVLAENKFQIDCVNDFLHSNPISSEVLDAHTFYAPVHYTRNLMYKCPQFVVLLLCWEGLQESPIHGHEGEKCWMRIESGTLEFTNYIEHQPPGGLEEVSSIVGNPGFIDGPAMIHQVKNPTRQPARSLHLYARPFVQCDVYHPNSHDKSRVNITYDTMYGKKVGS